jgi:N-acetylglucosamine-6-phosphate deacetylase
MVEAKIGEGKELTFFCPAVVTPRQRIAPAHLRVADGRITSIDRAEGPVAGARELPGTVIPGLIDLQVNGRGARDVLEGTVHAVEDIAGALLEEGVTGWLPTVISCATQTRLEALDTVAQALDRQRRGVVRGARILGAHLEGPWISRARAGAHDVDVLEQPNALAIEQSLRRQPGLVRIVTLAPELQGGLPAVRQIVAAGAVASIGHTDASYEEATDAVAAGARMATHLYNAMRPMHHRDPGVIGAVLTDPRVFAGVISDGIHVHPSTVLLVFRAKPERVALVSDVVAGERSDRAVFLSDGTLAGGLAGLWEGVTVAVNAGVMFEDAVQAATLTPAELLHLRMGVLAPGSPADFVVLDDRLRPRDTYLAGQRVSAS